MSAGLLYAEVKVRALRLISLDRTRLTDCITVYRAEGDARSTDHETQRRDVSTEAGARRMPRQGERNPVVDRRPAVVSGRPSAPGQFI